jgi:NitT/TauT family transport system substrate-binding protein
VDPNGIPSTAVVIVRKDFLDAYPDAVASFIRAHKDATAYINGNLTNALQVINAQIAEITQQPIDEYVLEKAFQRLEITSEIPFSSIMDFAKICVKEKMIAKMPDEKIINHTFIE